jgi:peptidoglycan/LPS O-acetylase OafA/YrhL
MYLYSYPVQRLLVRLIGPWLETRWSAMAPLGIFLATIPLAVACALASWWLVESPTMRIRRPVAAWLDRQLRAWMARAAIPRIHFGRMAPPPRETPAPLSGNHLAVDQAHP